MKIITRTFGGKPLTILLGCGDYELTFILNQVAEVCHIDSPSAAIAITMEATGGQEFLQLREVLPQIENPEQISAWGLEHDAGATWLASSAGTYRMLLRLDSVKEEFFYRWLIDYVLPEVKEMADAVLVSDVYSEEVDQLKAKIRQLERRLNAATARERRLQTLLDTLDKSLIGVTREVVALRRGMPKQTTCGNTTAPILDRVQSEFDEQAYEWKRALRRDETGLMRARWEEQMYRRAFSLKTPGS